MLNSLINALEATVTTPDYSGIVSAVTGQVTPELVVGIITAIIGSCLGLALLWFGARKIVGAIMSALHGKGISF